MPGWPSIIAGWGSTAVERGEAFPCDALVPEPDVELHRAIDVRARTETLFRWLCQMRAAPYSYDLLDNGGRRSPRALTPGLERLEVGQRFMRIFRLVEFEEGRSLTLISEGRLFGRVAVTYRVSEAGSGSRLVAKLLVGHSSRGLAGRAMRLVLPPGDLVMMRRQMLNLRRLAEAQEAGRER